MTNPNDNDSSAEAARAAAEARRQRILEQSRERMNVVEGVVATKEQEEDAAAAAKNARIQAIRRKRYGKSKKAVASAAAAAAAAESQDSEEKQVVKEEEPAKKEEEEDVKVPAAEKSKDTFTTPTEDTTTTTRKYQGVAKMRRKMVKEKREKMEQKVENEKEEDVPLAPPATIKIPVIHVLFQALAVVLLFASGFQVGMQQQQPSVEVTTVHRELSPRENGVGLLLSTLAVKNSDVVTVLEEEEEIVVNEEEEFSEEEQETPAIQKPKGVSSDSSERVPNIDPLFQVDLDELTEGPGLFMAAARCAVYVHRWNLYLFWELPKSAFATLMQLPRLLMSTPPVFMLLSLGIRQLTQRLGGTVKGEDEKKSKDVLAMLKGVVTNFLMGMFPTAVALYDVWIHLRSDMYVVLCGLFCGIALMHSTYYMETASATEEEVVSVGQDEL